MSHVEPDKVDRLTLCMKEEGLRQGEVPQLDQGAATLARDIVKKAHMEEVDTVAGPVKCNLLGRDLLAWTEILEQYEN